MIETIYIERQVLEHARTQAVLARFPRADRVYIDRYGEVFNRKSQNFRLQKRRPALILAAKQDGYVLPTPPGYGIGGANNYYFSHLLNCLYDCRYCFLQGMFSSAHYVLFVNLESFEQRIDALLAQHADEPVYFFSGYDCDSLALESVTHFVNDILPFFRSRPRAWLELRTKSVQTRPLLDVEPFDNCVVAFSLTPAAFAAALDHKAPSVKRRLDVIRRLSEHGWNIGLRFDPLIHGVGWQDQYSELFDQVFDVVAPERVHSVSYGPLRFPKAMFKDIVRLYPEEPLFAGPTSDATGMVAYPAEIESAMGDFCRSRLGEVLSDSVFFQCTPEAV